MEFQAQTRISEVELVVRDLTVRLRQATMVARRRSEHLVLLDQVCLDEVEGRTRFASEVDMRFWEKLENLGLAPYLLPTTKGTGISVSVGAAADFLREQDGACALYMSSPALAFFR